ncbi:flavin-containing monooxygenase [Sphingomonas sp. SRS2]|uniref:flavin-containing monooxygenase n=1 Tax=Sphingomonas sp. SRS2 TaxID=133190 RepID=UPI000698BA17|nr:NAD(P)/FAD-dependent oxidoreductase [Sphingomonas sp. SRS2]
MTEAGALKATDYPDLPRDDLVEEALRRAHLPSLLMSIIHITGDMSVMDRFPIKPRAWIVDDQQPFFSEEQTAEIFDLARSVFATYFENGHLKPLASAPSQQDLRRMMNYVAGADLPEQYVPFLHARLGVEAPDPTEKWASEALRKRGSDLHVAIIGAGMSGAQMSLRLSQMGIDYTIIDRNPDVGGTWLQNTYPGCRIDSSNQLYSISMAPRTDWTSYFPERPDIFKYVSDVYDKYDLRSHVRFGTTVTELEFLEDKSQWLVRTIDADGHENSLIADVVVTAVGHLSRPKFPDVPGSEKFKGPQFHSALWRHDIDLSDKRVAVIGSGASALQFGPRVAPDTREMLIFQRTAPWLVPTPTYHLEVPQGEMWLVENVPHYADWYRFWLFWSVADGVYDMAKVDPHWNGTPLSVSASNQVLREQLTDYIASQCGGDQELLEKCTPNYPPCGKRFIRDNGSWIKMLQRDNVSLIAEGIREITEEGVITESGALWPADVIVYGTGYSGSKFFEDIKITGKNGVEIQEKWQGDPGAYLGIAIAGYPNLFCMYGPNTGNVTNGSIIFNFECQSAYIMQCLKMLAETGKSQIDVKDKVYEDYMVEMDEGNRKMAWGSPYVDSWYKNDKGRTTANWPHLAIDYWVRTFTPNEDDFILS